MPLQVAVDRRACDAELVGDEQRVAAAPAERVLRRPRCAAGLIGLAAARLDIGERQARELRAPEVSPARRNRGAPTDGRGAPVTGDCHAGRSVAAGGLRLPPGHSTPMSYAQPPLCPHGALGDGQAFGVSFWACR